MGAPPNAKTNAHNEGVVRTADRQYPVGHARDEQYEGMVMTCAPYRLGEHDWSDQNRDVYNVDVSSRRSGYSDS